MKEEWGMDEGCKLCKAIDDEVWLDGENGFVILRTKNMKGHSKRCMIIGRHQNEVSQEVKGIAVSILLKFIMMNHRDYDWTIMEPTHATIPGHWHMVASTLDEGDDQALIADTDRIEIRFMKRGDVHHCECPNKKCGFCYN